MVVITQQDLLQITKMRIVFLSPVPFYEPILKFVVMINEHHSHKLNSDIQLMVTCMNCVQLINTWKCRIDQLIRS